MKAKKYNARYKLTYHKPRKSWKKVYQGATYYLEAGKGAKTDENYRLALAEWEALKARIDAGENTPVATPPTKAPAPVADTAAPFAGRSFDEFLHPHLVRSTSAGSTVTADDTTVNGLVAQFLLARRTQVDAGNLSVKQYAEDKAKLEDWKLFCGMRGIEQIEQATGTALNEYRDLTLRATISGDEENPAISAVTAKKRLAVLRKWLDWCYEIEALESLPRIHKKLAQVPLPKPKPRFFNVADVRELFKAADQRMKLFIALGVNCGFTQKDIATLTPDMVDWNQGLIVRQRSKTGADSKHKLWEVTLELLRREQAPAASEYLLLNQNGNPLYTEKLNANGNHVESDCIRLAWNRFIRSQEKADAAREADGESRRLQEPLGGFKYLRKTSANLIEGEYQEAPHIASLFLAHTDNSVKRHYASTAYELLFEAIDWLDSQYDFMASLSG